MKAKTNRLPLDLTAVCLSLPLQRVSQVVAVKRLAVQGHESRDRPPVGLEHLDSQRAPASVRVDENLVAHEHERAGGQDSRLRIRPRFHRDETVQPLLGLPDVHVQIIDVVQTVGTRQIDGSTLEGGD